MMKAWRVTVSSMVLAPLVSLATGGCDPRLSRCEEEPYDRVAVTGCSAGAGMAIEDAATFMGLCGVEAVDESFAPIDFSTRVVLGVHAEGTGCEVDFDQQVCRDDEARILTYEVFARSRGTCGRTVAQNGWVSIARPPDGWTYAFDAHEL